MEDFEDPPDSTYEALFLKSKHEHLQPNAEFEKRVKSYCGLGRGADLRFSIWAEASRTVATATFRKRLEGRQP